MSRCWVAITKRSQFLRLQQEGLRASGRFLTLLWRSNQAEGQCAVGFTVSRRVGGAVLRNRVRRRLKEIMRQQPNVCIANCQLVVIAKVSAANADYTAMQKELLCLIAKARVWAQQRI